MATKRGLETTETTQRREARRQFIIETAAKLFAEAGYADCEMDRVAAACGVAKGTLYLYFPGKQELFFAAVDLGMHQMQAALRAAYESATDPFKQIVKSIGAYLVFFEEHPHYVELLIQERAIFKDRKRSTYFEHRDEHRGRWRDHWLRMIAEGRVRDDLPVERIMDTIGSLLYGTMFTNHFIGRSVPREEQQHAIVEVMLRGLLKEGLGARG
ncbi:MAG: TetR/AcrR family transcriptional regulator [Planctomycetes bacterium]|nr:TetR/AcrR family transcriptional regulator [Planctomycetota bacterium]